MNSSTKIVLKVLHVIAWIIFVGLCIEACGFITNSLFTMLLNPVGARHFWQQVDLSDLYYHDRGYFVVENLVIIIVAVLKAIMFYQIIKILYNKKITTSQPFTEELAHFILKISYLAVTIGAFCMVGVKYTAWFISKGVK